MNDARTPVIVGVYQTKQARQLEGETSVSLTRETVSGALADAGLSLADVDGFNIGIGLQNDAAEAFAYQAGASYSWIGKTIPGPDAVIESAAAIRSGLCDTVLMSSAQAGLYTDKESTAPWTRPTHEFIETWGLHTPGEWALLARRHMHLYGGTEEQGAYIAALIRNNGSRNPEAVYYGRGPFTPEDIIASRPIASPYRLLDCATTTEGGAALVMTTKERAADLPGTAIEYLGGGYESWGPEYTYPPTWERKGQLGRKSANAAFDQAGIDRSDVDLLELYDNFSWEIIRYLEAYGYCKPGEGAEMATSGALDRGGRYPIVTDGGTMSHSHTGVSQILQRVIQAVRQLRGTSAANQVEGAKTALASWPYGLVLLGAR